MTLKITFYDGIQYHRQDFLNRDADFFGAGVTKTTDFPVTFPATPNMTVNIGQGAAWVDGYRISNDSTPVTLTVAAADSNPRIDIIQIGHDDSNSTYSLVVKKGVPASSNPVEPGADPGYVKLWAINVAAGATSVSLANFVDRRSLVPLNVDGSQISFAGVAGTNTANTFTGGNQIIGAQNAATLATQQVASWELGFSRSVWNGSVAQNKTSFLQVDTAGTFKFINESGSNTWNVDQSGNVTLSGGIQLNNFKSLQGEQTDGTVRNLAYVNTGNGAVFGDSNIETHIEGSQVATPHNILDDGSGGSTFINDMNILSAANPNAWSAGLKFHSRNASNVDNTAYIQADGYGGFQFFTNGSGSNTNILGVGNTGALTTPRNILDDGGGGMTLGGLLKMHGVSGQHTAHVYDNGGVKLGFGVDLSGGPRELSIFSSSSTGTDGFTSIGHYLESDGTYHSHLVIQNNGAVGTSKNLLDDGSGNMSVRVNQQMGRQTSYTGASYAGQWTKMGSIVTTGQYVSCNTVIDFISGDSGNGGFARGRVYWRVKQQNALGNPPIINLVLTGETDGVNFSAVVVQNDATATQVDLYVKIVQGFDLIRYIPHIVWGSGAVATWYESQAFVTSLPAGIVVNAGYSYHYSDVTFAGKDNAIAMFQNYDKTAAGMAYGSYYDGAANTWATTDSSKAQMLLWMDSAATSPEVAIYTSSAGHNSEWYKKFAVADSGKVYTTNNTLDDGAGAAFFAGDVTMEAVGNGWSRAAIFQNGTHAPYIQTASDGSLYFNTGTTVALKMAQNNAVTTTYNTLDDGSGNAEIKQNLVVGTAGSVTGSIGLYPSTADAWYWITNNAGNIQITDGSSPGGTVHFSINGDNVNTAHNTLDDGAGGATFRYASIQARGTDGGANNAFINFDAPDLSNLGALFYEATTGKMVLRAGVSADLSITPGGVITTPYNTLDNGSGSATFQGSVTVGDIICAQTTGATGIRLNAVGITGGWARGFGLYDTTGTTFSGGIGFNGSGSTNSTMYMAYGATPWDIQGGVGLWIQPNGSVKTQHNTLDDGNGVALFTGYNVDISQGGGSDSFFSVKGKGVIGSFPGWNANMLYINTHTEGTETASYTSVKIKGQVFTDNSTLDDGSGGAAFQGLVSINGATTGVTNAGAARFGRFDRVTGSLVAQLGNSGGGSQTFDIVNSGWTKTIFSATDSGHVNTYNNVLDDGAGAATFIGQVQVKSGLSVTELGTSTEAGIISGAPTNGSFFANASTGDLIIRNQNNTDIMFGFNGAGGAENAALAITYNGGHNVAKVVTQRNTLDDGTGGMCLTGELLVRNSDNTAQYAQLGSHNSVSVNGVSASLLGFAVQGAAWYAAMDTGGNLGLAGGINASGNLTTSNALIVGTGLGGEIASFKAGGSNDHAYVGFYARSASPGTRSGYMGYPSNGATTLIISNGIGDVNIDTTTGNGVKLNGSVAWHDGAFSYRSNVLASNNASQTISASTETKIAFQSVTTDHLGEFDTTNYRFTAQKTGVYAVDFRISATGFATTSNTEIDAYVNGVSTKSFYQGVPNPGSSFSTLVGMSKIQLNAGDYLELYVYSASATINAGSKIEITRIA